MSSNMFPVFCCIILGNVLRILSKYVENMEKVIYTENVLAN